MKIGITADLHLRKNNIERYNALKYILNTLKDKEINNLIIAGDLFDKETVDYSLFEKICYDFKDIEIILLPGNHDENIEQRFFTIKNIRVLKEITMLNFDKVYLLLVPYISKSSMDEEITTFFMDKEVPKNWILIGHGDYLTSKRAENKYEIGFYMRLTSNIIDRFSPKIVLLGHIHKPEKYGKVIYTGSPVGIDFTETGKRRFLILNTEKMEVEYEYVKTDIIYFSEDILVTPINEIENVKNKLDTMIKKWDLEENEMNKVRLKLKVYGYSYERNILKDEILKHLLLRNIIFKEEDLEFNVKVVKEDVRFYLLEKFLNVVEEVQINKICSFAEKNDIIEAAMETIFGE